MIENSFFETLTLLQLYDEGSKRSQRELFNPTP
jgi:hypothetical protein